MRTNREASSRPYGSIKVSLFHQLGSDELDLDDTPLCCLSVCCLVIQTAERPRSSFAGGAADELYRSECRAGKMKKRVKRAPHSE